MDQIDKKILGILHESARISMQKLAKEIHMSVPAVCERVHKLEDKGIIEKYTIKINHEKIDQTITAFMLFAPPIGQLEQAMDWAKEDPRIISCNTLVGKYAMMMKVSCSDMVEYSNFLDEVCTRGTSESYIIVKQVKDDTYFSDTNEKQL